MRRARRSKASDHPVFLLDRRHTVLALNAAASAYVQARGPLRMVAKKLAGVPAFRGEAMRLKTRDAVLVIERLLPPPEHARPRSDAACLLTIYPPERSRKSNVGIWTAKFGLTPTEARVAGRIWAGRTIKQAAEEMAIAASTAKSHLLSVFRKTGASRQSELVRILADTTLA